MRPRICNLIFDRRFAIWVSFRFRLTRSNSSNSPYSYRSLMKVLRCASVRHRLPKYCSQASWCVLLRTGLTSWIGGRQASAKCSGSTSMSRSRVRYAICRLVIAASRSLSSRSPGFPILSPGSERVIASGRFCMNSSMPSIGSARRSDQ